MKTFWPRLLLAAVIAPAFLPVLSAAQVSLPERQSRWLAEDAVYIITPSEREVFLKLGSDRERDLFIDAFWKHRDPDSGTAENEFRTQHYQRIAYANRYFGRTSPVPGWKTDRGRIHIILGAPQDIQRFEGKSGTNNVEAWFYQDMTDLGLPPGFQIVFFQAGNNGDYRLYSPANDGPQALLTAYDGDPADYSAAYRKLNEIQPGLAAVSLSLIPGESSASGGRPSLASDLLLRKVEESPRTRVEESYARKFLEFKDLVEVEYSANYMDSDALFFLVREPAGPWFVHYAVEPRRLSVGGAGEKYSTTLRLNGMVTAPDGRLIHQFEKTFAVGLDEARLKELTRLPFDLHDLFPLIPGAYKLSLLLKNEVSKEFTSQERTLLIPQDGGSSLALTAPVLAYKSVPGAATDKLKPFRFGSTQLYAQPGRVFTRMDPLFVAFQAFVPEGAGRKNISLRLVLTRDGSPVADRTLWLRDCPELPFVVEEFSLKDFIPAHYGIRITLLDGVREIVSAADEFDVTHQEAIPRPWFHSKLLPGPDDPVHDRIIGVQFLRAGQAAEAIAALERALVRAPDDPPTLNALAESRLAAGKKGEALEAFEKSLRIAPDQPQVRKAVAALKEKKQ